MPRVSVPPSSPVASATEKADRQILLEALQKTSRGEKLTARESDVYRRYLREQEEEARWGYYRTIPQKHVKAMTGRRLNQLQEVATLDGWPCDGKTLDLPVFLRFIFDWRAKYARTFRNQDDDPLLVGPGSPALENYRKVKTKRELFAHERELGNVRSIQEVEAVYRAFSSALRQGCERIQRNNLCGTEAVEQIRECVEAWERSLEETFGIENVPPALPAHDSDGDSIPVPN